MNDSRTEPAGWSPSSEFDDSRFSQYLSFRFYKENLDHVTDRTRDSINHFLKTISEIEDEFVIILRNQRMKNFEFHDPGIENENAAYMEENY